MSMNHINEDVHCSFRNDRSNRRKPRVGRKDDVLNVKEDGHVEPMVVKQEAVEDREKNLLENGRRKG